MADIDSLYLSQMESLLRPVTPEVAGSSPVAPVGSEPRYGAVSSFWAVGFGSTRDDPE
jgi:hypothetical protein